MGGARVLEAHQHTSRRSSKRDIVRATPSFAHLASICTYKGICAARRFSQRQTPLPESSHPRSKRPLQRMALATESSQQTRKSSRIVSTLDQASEVVGVGAGAEVSPGTKAVLRERTPSLSPRSAPELASASLNCPLEGTRTHSGRSEARNGHWPLALQA